MNGTKIFITNAGEADVYIIFAMTDKSKGTHGISAFIVEKGMPGFTFGLHEKKLGIRGSATSELIFNNVEIPVENLLGKEGQGFKIAMQTLDGGRIGIAAQALGIAQGAIDEVVPYVKARKQFGRAQSLNSRIHNSSLPICNVRQMQLRMLVYRAAMAKEKWGNHDTVLAAEAKLFAAEVAMEVTTKAIQLMGGYGYTRDLPVLKECSVMPRSLKSTKVHLKYNVWLSPVRYYDRKESLNMKIVVLVKQVPDSTEITVDKNTGTLVRDGVPSIINPDDLAGLEAAFTIKRCKS